MCCNATVRFIWFSGFPVTVAFFLTHFLMSCEEYENVFEFLKYLPFANFWENMVSFAVALTVHCKHEWHCTAWFIQLYTISTASYHFTAGTYFSQRLFFCVFSNTILWNTQISQPVIYYRHHTFPKLEHFCNVESIHARAMCVSDSASTVCKDILRTQLTKPVVLQSHLCLYCM